jgi:cytidylate kinase
MSESQDRGRRTSSLPPSSGRLQHRSVDALVEQQVMLWEAREQVAHFAPREQAHWPIVTISREFGALGAYIGELLAKRMGFALWDRQLLQAVAEMVGSSVADVTSVDERAPTALEEFLALTLNVMDVPSAEICDSLRQVVKTLERHGSALVVGRGAHLIAQPHRAFRVRVTAPFEYRARAFAEREGISYSEARTRVLRADRDRRAYIEKRFHVHADDPQHFDLIVNLEYLSVDAVLRVVLEGYRSKFGRLPREAQPQPSRAAKPAALQTVALR